ncbi:MAG TPA: CehA/McbA family metallohydrolase [Kofleriaceae bacterium]|nr:CehA/McbA family metallohydrolase [Kofleriaceae bacterium]
MTGRARPEVFLACAIGAACAACAACATQDVSPPVAPISPPLADGPSSSAGPEGAEAVDELDPREPFEPGVSVESVEPIPLGPADVLPAEAEVWLKGATHVHARASGDSSEPVGNVIGWYQQHGYDFIVLTDHNRVSELDPASDTRGQVTLRDPHAGLIVFSGIELTHNPIGCLPVGDPSRNCRIHVNLIGPTARPAGRIEWAERHSHLRIDMYQAAAVAHAALGGIAQINHPQWLWGMNPDLLVELSHRGMPLIEIANAAFSKWNVGDAAHPSTEALWDAALGRGATLWGVASDDAHDYEGHGKYPPGGGWVVVRARRDPRAILDALAAGRFYASNGVVLERADVEGDELAIAVDPAAPGSYTIDFIENGRRVDSVHGRFARRRVPAAGYVRAVVTRSDGKRAWVQPARR